MRDICVCRKLGTAVRQVHQLRWYVALPQASKALLAQNVLEGAQCSFVRGTRDMANAQRVGERMDLELQADLDDVEGSYHEAIPASAHGVTGGNKEGIEIPRD